MSQFKILAFLMLAALAISWAEQTLKRRRDKVRGRRTRRAMREHESLALTILITFARLAIIGIIGGMAMYGYLSWKYM